MGVLRRCDAYCRFPIRASYPSRVGEQELAACEGELARLGPAVVLRDAGQPDPPCTSLQGVA